MSACTPDGTEYVNDNYECTLCSTTLVIIIFLINIKSNCAKCAKNSSNILVCTECSASYYIRIDPKDGCTLNCSAITTPITSFGFANFSASGIWKCIKSCDVISGFVSQAIVGNCVLNCGGDGTASPGAANKLASDGKTCTTACAAGYLHI